MSHEHVPMPINQLLHQSQLNNDGEFYAFGQVNTLNTFIQSNINRFTLCTRVFIGIPGMPGVYVQVARTTSEVRINATQHIYLLVLVTNN